MSRRIFDVSWTTIYRILIALAAVWVWLHIWPVTVVSSVSIILAVALEPIVEWLEAKNFPGWLAGCAPVLVIVALIGGFLMLAATSLSKEASQSGPQLTSIVQQLHKTTPWIDGVIPGTAAIQRFATAFVQSAMSAAVSITIGLILTIYLLIERKATIHWAVAFVPARLRPKVLLTISEARAVVAAYVAGNVVTSLFAVVYVFAAMTILHVPAAMLLALLAGICDFVPVLGFILSAVPAIMLASSGSPGKALIVAALYIAYHLIENYLIAPLVYGGQLRLSNVAIILAFAIGGEVAGVIGALLALPIAAMYPVIERIWLQEYLTGGAVRQHKVAASILKS